MSPPRGVVWNNPPSISALVAEQLVVLG